MSFVLSALLYAFMGCLLIRAVFSFVEPVPKNMVHRLTFRITEPVIGPVRRLVPPIAGFDVAFLLVFFGVSIVLQLVQGLR